MRTRTCAHTSAAPPRTTAAHASTTDRARSAAVRAGPGAAHTRYNVVTEAVFHAPMFALKADAELNACEPRPRRSSAAAGSARMRWRGCGRAHAHTRARARPHARLGAYVAHDRFGDTRVRRSAYRAGRVHALYMNTDPSVCVGPWLRGEGTVLAHTNGSAMPSAPRTRARWHAWVRHRRTRAWHSREAAFTYVIIQRSTDLSDAWVPSEVHTRRQHAHKRARSSSGSQARAYAAAGVRPGDPHMRREIFTSLRSHITPRQKYR
jgi:hypothetical protein